MRIDLSEILNGRTKTLDFSFEFEPEVRDDLALLPDNIHLKRPIKVEGKITDKNGYLQIDSKVTVEYKTTCDRCLDEIDKTFEMEFERMIASSKKMVQNDMIDEEDIVYINDGFVDFTPELIEELSLELPTYHLCREDCPGLCPKCGKKLALGDCGCREEKEIDPRFAILKKLLDK